MGSLKGHPRRRQRSICTSPHPQEPMLERLEARLLLSVSLNPTAEFQSPLDARTPGSSIDLPKPPEHNLVSHSAHAEFDGRSGYVEYRFVVQPADGNSADVLAAGSVLELVGQPLEPTAPGRPAVDFDSVSSIPERSTGTLSNETRSGRMDMLSGRKMYVSASTGSLAEDSTTGDGATAANPIELYSGAVYMLIEDATGSGQYYAMKTGSPAPPGAKVTNLQYRTRISGNGDGDSYRADYELWLFSGGTGSSNDVQWGASVDDNLVGRTDGGYDDDAADDLDIYLNWRSTSYFNNEDPNQWWGIVSYDNWSGDDGWMD